MAHRLRLLLPVCFALALAGCGEKGPPPGAPMADPAPVHGKVTLPSGAALKGGVLTFHPVDVESGGKLRFEGAALVNVKGEYVAGFNGDGKGVAPGDYVVTAAPRDMNEVPGSNSGSIPAAYRNKKTSPLKISVKDGDNKIDLTIK